MRRPVAPLTLPGPTRFARIDRLPARIVLALLALLLGTLLLAGDAAPGSDTERRLGFNASLVDRLRHGGEDYYTAALAALRGSELPIDAAALPQPAVPLLAALPTVIPAAAAAILMAALIVAWWGRFPRIGGLFNPAVALLIIGSTASGRPGMITVPAVWAGLLIAAAIGLRRPERWLEAVALGASAAIVEPSAMLLPVVMAAAAWRDGARRETIGWIAALAVAASVFAIHLIAAGDAIGSLGESPPWSMAGPIAALHAVAQASGLAPLPAGAGMAIVLLSTMGWLAWRNPLAIRAGAAMLVALGILALSPVDATQAALLLAPISLLGLLPAIDGVRSLFAAALDSRRITVTRVTR